MSLEIMDYCTVKKNWEANSILSRKNMTTVSTWFNSPLDLNETLLKRHCIPLSAL